MIPDGISNGKQYVGEDQTTSLFEEEPCAEISKVDTTTYRNEKEEVSTTHATSCSVVSTIVCKRCKKDEENQTHVIAFATHTNETSKMREREEIRQSHDVKEQTEEPVGHEKKSVIGNANETGIRSFRALAALRNAPLMSEEMRSGPPQCQTKHPELFCRSASS